MAYKCNYAITGITSGSVSSAITLLELDTVSRPAEILRIWITQSSGVNSSQTGVKILYKDTGITGTAVTPVPHGDTGWPAAVGSAKINATVEGVDSSTNVFIYDHFNVLNGWLYLPVTDERLYVPVSTKVALKLVSPVTNLTYSYGMIYREH